MKKIIVFIMAIMISIAMYAQKNITTFMGIPVDGSKSEMIEKLKTKGFKTSDNLSDVLYGEFNGKNVILSVVTNNNKVYRIMVKDAYPSTEGDIKINFNRLCEQFKRNDKYIPTNFIGEFEISNEERIYYEMLVNKKRYEASYYQISEADKDTTEFNQWIKRKLEETYTEEQLENISEHDASLLGLTLMKDYVEEKMSHKSVWFMITQDFDKYYINLYYDNENNMANGEDL